MTETTRARTPVPPPLENGDSVDLDRAYAPIEEVEDWKANYNKATDACVALRAENERLESELKLADRANYEHSEANRRLRAALDKIAACKHVGTKAMQMVQTIARAALQSKGE